MTRRAACTLLLLFAAACGRDDARAVGDEGGLPAYEVSAQPGVVLEDDGTPEKLFGRVAARRLPDGGIVVADMGAASIHVFGRDGRVVRRLARRGSGPGELQGNVRLTSHADTIFAFGQPPFAPPDVSVYTAGRGFVSRTRPAARDARTVTVLDRLTTGEHVVRRGMAARAFWTVPEPGLLLPDTVVYGLLRASDDTSRVDVVWLPPIVQGWLVTFPARLGRATTSMAPYTLGPTTSVVASGDRLWIIQSDSGRFRALGGDGREVVAGRLSLAPRPFDITQVDRARARALAAATRALDSAKARAVYDAARLPPTAPLVSAAHAGADGELWVRLFDLDAAAPHRYLVLSRAGREIAQATLPANLDVHHIGADFVLGVRRDSLGVESVHEHALRRR